MRFKKTIITTVTALSIGAVSLGVAVPAATAATAPAKPALSVSIDRAHHSATVKTPKRGTLTVNWEALAKGKHDLVTVRNSAKKLIAVRTVGEERLTKVLAAAEKKPGAIRHLWHVAKDHHAAKASVKQ